VIKTADSANNRYIRNSIMKDVLSLLFIAFVMLVPYIVNYYSSQNYKVVYINTAPSYIPKRKINKVIPKKNIAAPEIVKQEEYINPIKDEALECLISLGMKKSDAKEKVKQLWKNKNYISIESFLIDAYKI
jgi:hypothetical protein